LSRYAVALKIGVDGVTKGRYRLDRRLREELEENTDKEVDMIDLRKV